MRKDSEQTPGRTDGAMPRASRIVRVTKVLEGILFLALLLNPIPVVSLTLPGAYRVTLAWNVSPSPEVAGYRVYYGEASGSYSNSIVAGNVTTDTISGLTGGVTYFFAVTAYDTNGVESPFSNEISFVPGLPETGLGVAVTGELVLKVKGLIGHTYEVEATEDFTTWSVIGSVTLGASGSLGFTDTNAASFPKRFYRTRQKF